MATSSSSLADPSCFLSISTRHWRSRRRALQRKFCWCCNFKNSWKPPIKWKFYDLSQRLGRIIFILHKPRQFSRLRLSLRYQFGRHWLAIANSGRCGESIIPMRLYANRSATVANDFAAGLRPNFNGTDCDRPALPTLQYSPIYAKKKGIQMTLRKQLIEKNQTRS